ncbi:hypothetical protein KUCAC02_025437, partial [Chaenocephalus aceratus]
ENSCSSAMQSDGSCLVAPHKHLPAFRNTKRKVNSAMRSPALCVGSTPRGRGYHDTSLSPLHPTTHSILGFRVFRGVEASNSVTFLCGLCVFVPECVYCTARALTNPTTQKPCDFTIAAWRYLDSGGEASLSPGAPSAKGFGVHQLGSSAGCAGE